MVDLIVTLVRKWKLEISAHGIEKAGHYEVLKNLYCPFGQGYFFSPRWRPTPPANSCTNKTLPCARPWPILADVLLSPNRIKEQVSVPDDVLFRLGRHPQMHHRPTTSGLVRRPFRQPATVRISAVREIGPVFLHLFA